MQKRRAGSAPPRTPPDTRERLLRAAEAQFVAHGYEGASLRLVTATAGANIAAANYHFGGKDGLLQAMLAEQLDPMNAERESLLVAYEAESGARPLACERILAAMFIPALRRAREEREHGRDFLCLLGRAYVDPAPAIRAFLSDRYATTIERFKDAFGRALPHLPKQELSWRLHFTLGALSYTLAGADAWRLIASIAPESSDDDARLLRRMAPFLIAGLQAPVPDLDAADAMAQPLVTRARARHGRRAAAPEVQS